MKPAREIPGGPATVLRRRGAMRNVVRGPADRASVHLRRAMTMAPAVAALANVGLAVLVNAVLAIVLRRRLAGRVALAIGLIRVRIADRAGLVVPA